jgi:hypothetical protein
LARSLGALEPGIDPTHILKAANGWLKGAVMDLEHYLAKMREFERIAEQSRDPMVRKAYLDWLHQLRELMADAAARQSVKGP